jgi:hypothetical protein
MPFSKHETDVIIYFDLETYSPQEEPRFGDKIITIQYREVGGREPVILKEWEDGEEMILRKFYDYLLGKLKTQAITIIGFNLLLFDKPLLTYKLHSFNIDGLENILNNFKEKIYWRDLRYCLYPLNNLSFKGLNEDEVAEKLRIRSPKYSNKEISKFYEGGAYEKIEEHIKSEFDFLNDLNRKLSEKREADPIIEVRKLLTGC